MPQRDDIVFGEGRKVNKDDLKLLSKLHELYRYLKYDFANIYNMNETCLFYKIPPKYGFFLAENSTLAEQRKRVTRVLCANSAVRFTLKLIINQQSFYSTKIYFYNFRQWDTTIVTNFKLR